MRNPRWPALLLPLLCGGCFEPALLSLAWPLAGEDWVVQFYVDHDGVDYNGGNKTYAGHAGTDIVISSFRAMDAGVEVHAASSGEVIDLEDGFFDRQTEFDADCDRLANRVTVRDVSGANVTYLHFKRDSIRVQVGDAVETGDVLGLVGSSGCSDWPHVHVEVRDFLNTLYDPFVEGWWIDPPPYDPPLHFLEGWVVEGDLRQSVADTLLEIPPQPELFARNRPLTLALRYAGGTDDEESGVDVADDTGAVVSGFRSALGRPFRISTWTWPVTPTTSGAWEARAFVNGDEAATIPFDVE